MSENLIDYEDGYGFILTQFAGPIGRGRMYQINEGRGYVRLDTPQMLKLVAAFLHNLSESYPPRKTA